MRLAGTCKQYSKKAMPQLANTTIHSGDYLKRRWPYHAKVMNTLLPINKSTGKTELYTGPDNKAPVGQAIEFRSVASNLIVGHAVFV